MEVNKRRGSHPCASGCAACFTFCTLRTDEKPVGMRSSAICESSDGVVAGDHFSSGSGPIVICDNLERRNNMAAVIRICSSIDCAALLFVHDPASGRKYPKHVNILDESGKEGKTWWREGRGHYVKVEEVDSFLPADRVVFGVDTAPGAVDLFRDGASPACEVKRSCFIFGNESDGISQSLARLCDAFIYIPSPGRMKSLNASVSVVVVLFEWARQRFHAEGPQALLQQIAQAESTHSVEINQKPTEATPSVLPAFDFFSGDRLENGLPGSGPVVICDNLSSSNRAGIGAIIRLCCNMDCSELLLVHDQKRDAIKESTILRASAQGQAFWKEGRGRYVTTEGLETSLPTDRVVYGVQVAPGAVDVFTVDLCPVHDDRKACFIFSASPEGISESLLCLCDALIYVPCPGQLKSLHVSHSVAVVLFQWLRQKKTHIEAVQAAMDQ
eukprot:TRINITY_DN105581_c0_g1_i1.p1 TRINITY_DN105581_c0_g1~~TRINITY_DN105581_c0_g1_i1.p1  ORF type:complete len:443 (-),score=13.66 TRINITY_DN105581_c0_g1_i1:46-1374(-)